MGLGKSFSGGSNSQVQKEYCADITNNFLYVDGVKYEPYEVTNIVGMKHAYYHVPESVHTDLKNPYRFASFIFYDFGDTTYITQNFYKPTSMCNSNNGLVIEDTEHDYCVVIEKG